MSVRTSPKCWSVQQTHCGWDGPVSTSPSWEDVLPTPGCVHAHHEGRTRMQGSTQFLLSSAIFQHHTTSNLFIFLLEKREFSSQNKFLLVQQDNRSDLNTAKRDLLKRIYKNTVQESWVQINPSVAVWCYPTEFPQKIISQKSREFPNKD